MHSKDYFHIPLSLPGTKILFDTYSASIQVLLLSMGDTQIAVSLDSLSAEASIKANVLIRQSRVGLFCFGSSILNNSLLHNEVEEEAVIFLGHGISHYCDRKLVIS